MYCVGSRFVKTSSSPNCCLLAPKKIRSLVLRCSVLEHGIKELGANKCKEDPTFFNRRCAIGLLFAMSGLGAVHFDAKGAGLPPEQKPKLCDDACEKELENVW